MIYRVPAHLLADLWPTIEPYANAACRKQHPFMQGQDVLALGLFGKVTFFIATDDAGVLGFAAAEVIQYPRCKVANVLAGGGRKGFLVVADQELYPEMERWALEQGADAFAVTGRPGWLRFTRRYAGVNVVRYATSWKVLGNGVRRRQPNNDSTAVERGATVPAPELQPGIEPRQ